MPANLDFSTLCLGMLFAALMGIMEKRRFRNFIGFVQQYENNDPQTWKEVKPDDMAHQVYKKFGLDENTQDFIGHALALYLNDE